MTEYEEISRINFKKKIISNFEICWFSPLRDLRYLIDFEVSSSHYNSFVMCQVLPSTLNKAVCGFLN